MSQVSYFIDCRGLSAPLTVLRIKQAMIGRPETYMPLDVIVDGALCDCGQVEGSLTDECTDIRLLQVAEIPATEATDRQARA